MFELYEDASLSPGIDEYERGYAAGITCLDLERLGADGDALVEVQTKLKAIVEALCQTHRIDAGPYSERESLLYWIGYFHGRQARRSIKDWLLSQPAGPPHRD